MPLFHIVNFQYTGNQELGAANILHRNWLPASRIASDRNDDKGDIFRTLLDNEAFTNKPLYNQLPRLRIQRVVDSPKFTINTAKNSR